MKFLAMIFSVIGITAINVHGMDIQIAVKKAHINGHVEIEVQNQMDHVARLWETGNNSWGWNNWTIEFFADNSLTVFVRKPDEGFTMNIPRYIEIPSKSSRTIEFNLDDGTWVSHRIQMWPAYPSKVDKKNAIRCCFAVLAIPKSKESEEFSVWTGMIASPSLQK
jgi:hypothetical protein